jgi:hypothetical protein
LSDALIDALMRERANMQNYAQCVAAAFAALALVPSTAYAADDAGLSAPGMKARSHARGVGAEAGFQLRFGGRDGADERLKFELRGGPAFEAGSFPGGNKHNGRSHVRIRPVIALSVAPKHAAKLLVANQTVAAHRFMPLRTPGTESVRPQAPKLGISNGGAVAIGAGVTFVILAALLADDIF